MRILLVSANFHWSEGAIAKGIVKALPEDDVYFFSIYEFKYRYKEFESLLEQVDIVHWLFNVGHLGDNRKQAYREITIPKIATVHHVCLDEQYKIDEASHADVIHVVSNEWLNSLKSRTNTKIISASLGIMLEDFTQVKSKLYTGTGTFKIGMMGSYPGKDNRKRVDIAIKVLKKLVANKIDVELIVQGSGWDLYYKDLQDANIIYTHHKLTADSEALKFFELIHVYLCTSDYEGGPLPVLESLASGVPVVSTNIGVAADALSHGGGILCAKEDTVALAEALLVMKAQHDTYLNYALQAKAIASKYAWEALGLAYTTLFKETILGWEATHASSWNYKASKIVKAEAQRDRELLYDNLSQSMQLINRGKKVEGLKLAIHPLLSTKINFNRKVIYFRRVLSLLIKQR